MADRTVSVKLVADAQAYIRGVEEAARKTRESSDQIEQRLAAQREAYNQVGVAALAVGTVAAAGVLAAVNAYAEFDAAMSNVQAATGESAANMRELSDAALEAGARTVYSATEAAAAIEELSKAGVSTADILNGGLDGALDLAAAGQIDVAEAAETAASAMTQFGLEGSDVTHIADLLAAAAGNAQGGVSDMGQALGQAGLVASQMGLSIEETTGTLAAFASAGLIGSDAGTSFRAMLLRLANPTNEVTELMSQLGLQFYDAQGDFIGMEGVASQLTTQLSGLTQEQRNAALATIFGQDAIRAASILYSEGAEGVAEWTDTVNDSGYAAEQAASRLDNLQGDLEALGGAFETLLINLGSSADGPLRAAVQGLDEFISSLAEADPLLLSIALGAGALVAALGLGVGAFLTIVPQIAATSAALVTLGVSAATARAGLASMATFLGNPYVVAAAAAVAGLLLLNNALESTRASASEWQATITGGATAVQLFNRANEGINMSSWELTADNIENVGSYLDLLEARADNAWAALNPDNIELDNSGFLDTLNRIDEQLGSIADAGDFDSVLSSFANLSEGLELTESQAAQLLDTMPQVRDAFVDAYGASVVGADGSIETADLLAAAYATTGDAAQSFSGDLSDQEQAAANAEQSITDLADAIRGLNDTYYAAQNANADYNQSILDVTAAINDGLLQATVDASGNIDTTTESGINAQSMLSGLAGSALESAAAMIELDGNTAGANARIVDARQRFIDAAVAAGINRDAAGQLADAYGLTENAVNDLSQQILAVPDGQTTITANTSPAENAMALFFQRWDGRTIRINTATGGISGPLAPGADIAYADGGRIPGYAPGFDDRFGFLRDGTVVGLGGGEYVMPTLMTDRYLPILEKMRTGEYTGYAGGGQIGRGQMSNSYYTGGSTFITNEIAIPISVPVSQDVQLAARQVKREFANESVGVTW